MNTLMLHLIRLPIRKKPLSSTIIKFNGEPMDEPMLIDRFGRAQWTSPELKAGEYKISAVFLPARGDDGNLASRSFDLVHVVRGQ